MFILASGSPRRKELLHKLLDEFQIIVPDVDEHAFPLPAKDLPGALSKAKAYAVYKDHPNDEVLACDTIVILDNEVLGKPKSPQNAIERLLNESGKRQIVLSGYTYIGRGKEINRTVSTSVYFAPLTKEQIEEYVNKYRPYDKAGAYGIQEWIGYIGVTALSGSYFNVMGLPIQRLYTELKKLSVI